MNNIKLSWFNDQARSSLTIIKQYKYTSYIALTSASIITVLLYTKPTFTKVLLKAIGFFALSPIVAVLHGSISGTYYFLSRDIWMRLNRAWQELEVGNTIPDELQIVHLNQYTQSLTNLLRDCDFRKKDNKYAALIFGSCT